MNIRSATFVKGVVGTDTIFEDGKPQIVFIGRSNVGKSSVINLVANSKNLAITSSTPGRTQQINIFLINKNFYLVDIPGYGYAKVPDAIRNKIQKMINWYLFNSNYPFKKVVLIIDAKIGPTYDDMEMLAALQNSKKEIVVVANKVDKIKTSEYDEQIQKIRDIFDPHKVIPFSAEKKIGLGELTVELLK